jgi:PAS domain S-box-containing protein
VNIKEPLFSVDEHKRLAALDSYDVLDTLPEKEYDAITRLASYICQAPIALITLIDAERQWVKSRVGIEADYIPRVDSFCNHVILDDVIFEINDASENDTFKDNFQVIGEPFIRFYAGAPLIDPDGHRLGSLCVIDRVPRKLTQEQLDAMRTLADEVMSHMVLRRQKRELEASLATHRDFYTLFNSSPEIHAIVDIDANIELINDAVSPIFGFDRRDMVGRNLWDFVVGNKRDHYLPLLEKGIETQQSFEMETQNITVSGDIKWISWCAIHKAGKWYCSGRDITYQKKILADLEQLSLVASKMINGVIISDADDKVIWTNDAFTRITGFDLADVEHKRLRDILVAEAEGTRGVEEYNELIEKKKSYQLDIYANRKNGEKVWLTLINSVLYDANGNVEKYIRLIVDITAKKATEKDLNILSFAARKSPSGTLIRDNDGRVIWMNETLEKMLGYTFAEMKGKRFGHMLLGKDTDATAYNNALQAVIEKRAYEAELQLYRKDNTSLWGLLSNSPLMNELGEVERQITVILDITERKKADEQVKLLSLVASNTTSGVIINDKNGKVEWINPAFEKITGYNMDDVKGKPLGDTLKGELTDVSIIERARRLSKNKKSFEVDILSYRKNGQPMWISVINSVILNKQGEVDKYVEVIIDISSKKRVELELIAAKEEALQLNRAKDMFISVMSHEIRTPLNAVIGISNILLEDEPRESQKENLDILKFSADNLMMLINDVLDFTKIETGNIELEKADVNLREMVHRIISSMRYKAAEKDIYLQPDIDATLPTFVIADSARLIQILLNLVSNAIKFTDTGGITIGLKVLDESSNNIRIRFEVTDTGIGIAEDKLGTIFESFKQAEADTTRKYGGTGLGLAISKRLVELHDSRINVESVRGRGSTFSFVITFNKADSPTISAESKMEIGLSLSVLVVDDNQINRILVNKVLQKWGTRVDFAENGQQALDKIMATKGYDVVLMDVHMPIMGGLEATQILRAEADPYFKQLPIVALTASMLSNEVNQMTDAGMNDFILKPFDPKTLYDKLARYQK